MTGPSRAVFVAMALLAGSAAQAAELREPRPLLAAPQPAGACGSGRAAGLVLRESLRPDVGPYAVTLAGYGQGNDADADRYAPYLLRLDPGGATRIALRNALPGEAANLHTHGLFTSPRNAPPCDLGDYSLFAGPALGRVDYRIALPATLPGAAQGSGRPTVPYPLGLAWFHAHVHGIARDQVTSGMAGLITVGDPRAILPPALRPVTDVRHLALRDIQLSVPDCPGTGFLQDGRRCEPGALLPGPLRDGAAIPASFDVPGADDPRWDPGLCGDFDPDHPGEAPEGTILGEGFCARPQEGMSRHSVWLFTVNGQWMPEITLRPGRYTMLRVANLSANVTHVLQTGEPMHVLALDGALGGEPAAVGPGVVANRILMLPGARAEILLGGAGPARRLTLGTAGLATSRERDGDGELQGDVWPALALARIVIPAQAAPSPAWPPAISRPVEPPPVVGPAPLPAGIAEGCSVLPPDTAVHQWRRRVVVDRTRAEEGERFLVGQEVVDQEGRPYMPAPGDDPAIGRSWRAEPWNPPLGSPAGQHMPPANLICPVRGRGEVWEMVSPGQELHNLHIHQGSFRLARAGDPGAPPGLTPQAAMTDPAGLLGDLQRPEAAAALVWHDSLPIAPRRDGVPGRTFIYLPFAAEVQEGLYPVHCHILEHEDKGMIAAVRVLPPASGRQARAGSDDAILAALLDPEGRLPASCLVP